MLNPLRALTLGGLLLFSTLGHAAPAAPDALRIGYQKGSVSMVLAKSHQLLEQRYPQTHISWIEFPAGPQMLEALNVGSIDIGSTGDIPAYICPGGRRRFGLYRRGSRPSPRRR